MTKFDGTPCAVKAARTVWSRGKAGDHIKCLPMAIWCQISGHEAVDGELDVIKKRKGKAQSRRNRRLCQEIL